MTAGQLGAIITPAQGNTWPDGVPWCADNGCYGRGWPGEVEWFAWLQRLAPRADTCVFAVAPDVVADAPATLTRSLPWLGRIRQLGYPAAYAAQDGLTPDTTPWRALDVLFVGGSTAWKTGPHARTLILEAKARGKHVHMGRVNSAKRMRYAHAYGVDSVDGTYLTYGPEVNLPRVQGWLRGTEQPELFQLR